MPSPSSIFSFDTLQVHGSVPRGVLTAALLLGLVDFGLSRADWPYRKYPSSYVGAFLAQEETLRRDPIPPRIIILGNSRSKHGLLAQDMEQRLGLPAGSVLNLSIESGDHYDNYLFQRRNRQLMKSARLLIYGVDAYEWNASFPLSERFPHFAGFADRLNLDPSIPSLFGWFFRTEEKPALFHAMFRRINGALSAAIHLVQPADANDPPTPEATTTPAKLGPVNGRIAFWYRNFRLAPNRQELLQRLIATAQEDGQQVVVLQLPFRDEYMNELLRNHASDYQAYEQSIRSLDGVQVSLFEAASAAGLEPTDFQDWDHLNTVGAKKFTRVWCQWLETHEPQTMAALASVAR
ncbi:MAG TPA: hypothetical protein VMP11_16210 [Verrucomicrobiae bacterium]|nr:hypothetical protein [Verrucomicrobiae bacterium]